MKTIASLCLAICLLSGCAEIPPTGEATTRSLAGDWVFEVKTGNSVAHGAMTLTADGSDYRGTLTTDQGNNVLAVRSLTLAGSNMDMLVESPNGNVTFKGTLSADASSFQGTVTYHNGQQFPMTGTRRQPAGQNQL
jgi:hypothetical protein